MIQTLSTSADQVQENAGSCFITPPHRPLIPFHTQPVVLLKNLCFTATLVVFYLLRFRCVIARRRRPSRCPGFPPERSGRCSRSELPLSGGAALRQESSREIHAAAGARAASEPRCCHTRGGTKDGETGTERGTVSTNLRR